MTGLVILVGLVESRIRSRPISPLAHRDKPTVQNQRATSPPNTQPSASQATGHPSPQPVKPATLQVLLDLQGSGGKQTNKFTVDGLWDLMWSYDCTVGGRRYFVAEVYDANGTISHTNSPVSQLGVKHNDIQHYHQAGTYYLNILSGCSWHVTVKG